MRKAQVFEEIREQTGVTLKDIEKVMEAAFIVIKKSVISDEPIYFRGFGTFAPIVQKAKIGNKISTGEQVVIPERKIIKFKPAKVFKDTLRDKTIKS